MAKRKTISTPSLFDLPSATPVTRKDPIQDTPAEMPVVEAVVPEKIDIVSEKGTIVSENAPFVPQIPPVPSPGKRSITLATGETLSLKDEVHCTYPGRDYEGKVYVIYEMNPYPHCMSGMNIKAYLKENPEEKIVGKFDGRGLDANWFKKIPA